VVSGLIIIKDVVWVEPARASRTPVLFQSKGSRVMT
jgi:hypothetical protein